MKKLLIINGPNINMLGVREPDIYGRLSYGELVKKIGEWASELGCEAECFQSNSEGEIVTKIQRAFFDEVDGIVINPAAYTHTSIAILDALKAVRIPAAEVHISDINTREEFRKTSYAGMACEAHFIGLGPDGYKKAMEYLCSK
ncbi:MAG: type II 3-dehydroquinate dehydratase [Ruminococcaceae bacterium]|nr:type II 3-dehydroquinate dehydratase [Oscillospiraceae bacterium]